VWLVSTNTKLVQLYGSMLWNIYGRMALDVKAVMKEKVKKEELER
jgi:hypothetical protein